jgi:catechol 2,3-dioxygenase-like lactoylglutathione lyase family enzyme
LSAPPTSTPPLSRRHPRPGRDPGFARIREAGVDYFADPRFQQPGEINTRWGGRGVYFHDPDGHSMELLTRAP